MNAVLLPTCVTSMPIVKTLSALIVVPVELDLLETGKRALVREEKNRELATVKRFEISRFKRKPFVGANREIVGCVWFIYRNMELPYWLVPGNVKNNRIN